MATPPESPTDSPRFPKLIPTPQRWDEFAKALKRRDWVIKRLGTDLLAPFEMWAFRRSPYAPGQMVYDSNITMHWQNAHSTKGVSEDPDQAVKDIVKIWLARFADDANETVIITDDQD